MTLASHGLKWMGSGGDEAHAQGRQEFLSPEGVSLGKPTRQLRNRRCRLLESGAKVKEPEPGG